MDKQLIYEQKQKRLQYTETKWKLCNETVNLSELKKKNEENNNEIRQLQDYLSTLLNFHTKYHAHSNQVILKINSIIDFLCDIKQKEFEIIKTKISGLLGRVHKNTNNNRKNELNRSVNGFNDSLSKLSREIISKYGNNGIIINIMKKYNLLPNTIKIFRWRQDITLYEMFETDNKETIDYIKSIDFSNNYNNFIKDVEELEEKIKQTNENIEKEKEQINILQKEKTVFENEMKQCKDKIQAAHIGVKIAEHSVKIEEIENTIKTMNIVEPEQAQLRQYITHKNNKNPDLITIINNFIASQVVCTKYQSHNGNHFSKNGFEAFDSMIYSIKNGLNEFETFEENIKKNEREIEDYKNNYLDGLKILKEMFEDLVDFDIEETNVIDDIKFEEHYFLNHDNIRNNLNISFTIKASKIENIENREEIMNIFEKIENSHFDENIKSNYYEPLKQDNKFYEDEETIKLLQEYECEFYETEAKAKEEAKARKEAEIMAKKEAEKAAKDAEMRAKDAEMRAKEVEKAAIYAGMMSNIKAMNDTHRAEKLAKTKAKETAKAKKDAEMRAKEAMEATRAPDKHQVFRNYQQNYQKQQSNIYNHEKMKHYNLLSAQYIKDIKICESNIKKYKEELVLKEELLDEINARIEYETAKKDFESFTI